LKNTLKVESSSAPLNADAASIPGATNSAYGMEWPLSSKAGISLPTPIPIENR
jgi:hypothetical protein